MLKGLHHAAYRCRDSEETRSFYEDFLGLPLVHSIHINQTITGREARLLHTFYEMEDGSCLAFFDAPGQPFEFKDQHDFDLHIALRVDAQTLHDMFEKGKASGIDTRGISQHGPFRSIYFRDPNGYVVELTADNDQPNAEQGFGQQDPHQNLNDWQASRSGSAQA